MKITFYVMVCLLTAVAGLGVGCSNQDEKKEAHFAPNPGDGITNQDRDSSHFGTNPGDPLIDSE